MSDGSWRTVKLKKAKVGADDFKAFGYRLKTAALKNGIEPTAVVAFGASGSRARAAGDRHRLIERPARGG
jgi:hypothetical protein